MSESDTKWIEEIAAEASREARSLYTAEEWDNLKAWAADRKRKRLAKAEADALQDAVATMGVIGDAKRL